MQFYELFKQITAGFSDKIAPFPSPIYWRGLG